MHTPVLNDPPVKRAAAGGAAPSDALLQRYRLEGEAARTESGVLYDAVENETLRRVMIEIANDLDDDARERFERDAMVAQRLEGEHVLQVLETGVLLDGTPYVIREPALGTLAADVAGRGPLPTAEAVALTLEVCEALAEAHTRGLAHGDVRGETVFLGRDDAGNPIAKVLWTSKAKAERAAREDVARDIAGAGLLLRFMITGQRDLEDEGARTLPSPLSHAVSRATSHDDAARFRNIGELASAIARFAPPGHTSARNVAIILSRAGIIGGLGSTAPSVPSVTAAPASVRPRAPSQPGLNDAWFEPRVSRTSLAPPPRRSARFAVVSLLLLAATLTGTVALHRSGRLPEWSGTAPAMMEDDQLEPVSRTTLTAADVAETTAITRPVILDAVATAPAERERAVAAPAATESERTEATPTTGAPESKDRFATPAGESPSSGSKAKAAPESEHTAEPWPGTGAIPSTTAAPAPTTTPSERAPDSPAAPPAGAPSNDPGF